MNKIVDLQVWCSEYDKVNKYPADTMRRFSIGVYQIYQGMEWLGSASSDESYAAAAIHFIIVGERLSLCTEQYLKRGIKSLVWKKQPWKALLYHISKAQGQIVYSTNTDNIKRKSRYSPEILESHLSECIGLCLGLIAPDKREEAIKTAISIMTGVL